MNPRIRNTGLFVAMCALGVLCGIGSYIFSGIITLVSLIALVENSSMLKAMTFHFNKLIDILLFAVGIYAKFMLGVTIGMAVMVAGVGYSMVYGPYVREMYRINNKSKK